MTPFEKALQITGGVSAMAKSLGLTPWAVSKWRHRVPAERCRQIEELTAGQVRREELRPDLFS